MPTLTEAQIVEQLEHQHDQYLEGATGLDVQDDQDVRLALDDSPHTEVENDELATGLESTTVTNYNGTINADVYDGGNIVQPAYGLANATWMEQQAQDAVQDGVAFTTGGPYTSDYSLLSPYVDPAWLIEYSKLTGEKWF
jgi:hypothetical protein